MKHEKKLLKGLLYVLLLPILYIAVSLVLTAITVNQEESNQGTDNTIYLATNGVHLDVIIPKKDMDSLLLTGLNYEASENYLAFGWGEENFYLNTPTWGDLTFRNAFKALFLDNNTLVHLTRHQHQQPDWIEINISDTEFQKLNTYLFNTFKTDSIGNKIRLENQGYTPQDDFYKANGSYSLFKTCNSWANSGFKQSGLKACLWTPFDFGLMGKYE